MIEEIRRLQAIKREYIVIVVDKFEKYGQPYPFQTENLRVDIFVKGQQMVGLNFMGTRPTLIIDSIVDRTLVRNGEDMFQKWYNMELLRNKGPNTLIIKRRPS